MLQTISDTPVIIHDDAYCITHKSGGLDELHFTLGIDDEQYKLITEDMQILETTEQQLYRISDIDAATSNVRVACDLDLRDWQARVHISMDQSGAIVGYKSGLKTATQIVSSVLPAGWSLAGDADKGQKADIEMQGPTDLDIMLQLEERLGVVFRFDTKEKRVSMVYPEDVQLGNQYVTDEVNLRRAPAYKGRTDEMYTRIYPVGADGLSIASVNGGRVYLEDTSYSGGAVISKVWYDNRYKDAQSLKDAAAAKLAEAARPTRSWQLDVIDLTAADPTRWPDLSLRLMSKLRLIDRHKGVRADVQVVQDKVYPYYPDRNEISVSTVSGSVQSSIRTILRQIGDTNSALWQQIIVGR